MLLSLTHRMTRNPTPVSRRAFLGASSQLCVGTVLAGLVGESKAQPTSIDSKAAAMATHSDIGSLYPIIEKNAVQSDFPFSFLNPRFKTAKRWKKEARAKVLDLLHYTPERCDPAPEIVERIDQGEYIREKLYFNTTPVIRVPAYLLVPKRGGKRQPAIVALHDHGGFYLWGKEKLVQTENEPPVLKKWRDDAYGGKSIAGVLAAMGYVVLVIDMFYWGERRMTLDDDPADWRDRPPTISMERINAFNQRSSQNEQLVGRTIYSAGFTWPGIMFWDDIRSVDYLLTRPEVDPDRIGCVGLSVGGVRSAHLAALDPRIKAAVVVGWMTSVPAQLKHHIRNTIGHTKVIPGLYRLMDYPDVAALAMPASLLVINGKKDGLFEPGGVNTAFEKLANCYKKAGIPERLKTRLYDSPHEFNTEMQEEAWDWLKRWV
jgi:dienelactone hydrolase